MGKDGADALIAWIERAEHAFQACSIDHSDISPFRINELQAVCLSHIIAKGLFKSSRSPMRFVFSGLPTAPITSSRTPCKTSYVARSLTAISLSQSRAAVP